MTIIKIEDSFIDSNLTRWTVTVDGRKAATIIKLHPADMYWGYGHAYRIEYVKTNLPKMKPRSVKTFGTAIQKIINHFEGWIGA